MDENEPAWVIQFQDGWYWTSETKTPYPISTPDIRSASRMSKVSAGRKIEFSATHPYWKGAQAVRVKHQ